jgi:TFIIF-interacting CTD phosphatase-like protein
VVIHRLYREATKFHNGAHIKDLSALNRDLKTVIITSKHC